MAHRKVRATSGKKRHNVATMALRLEAGQLRLGPQGCLVIPAEIRQQLGFKTGEPLVATIEDGRLVLEKPANVVRRLRRRFQAVPAGVSLARELILERRREAEREV